MSTLNLTSDCNLVLELCGAADESRRPLQFNRLDLIRHVVLINCFASQPSHGYIAIEN